nr:MAG TPA: hypothetical protein [Caudoviricetes sp.]
MFLQKRVFLLEYSFFMRVFLCFVPAMPLFLRVSTKIYAWIWQCDWENLGARHSVLKRFSW